MRLPKKVKVPFDIIPEEYIDEIDEKISDYLSNEYGFCHKGYDCEFCVTNIKWDTDEN